MVQRDIWDMIDKMAERITVLEERIERHCPTVVCGECGTVLSGARNRLKNGVAVCEDCWYK